VFIAHDFGLLLLKDVAVPEMRKATRLVDTQV
jgi:hypothetical protein